MIGIALLTIRWHISAALSDWKSLLYSALLMLMTLFYGLATTLVFRHLDPTIATQLVASTLFLLAIIRKFFPSMASFQQLAHKQYPIASGKRYALNLIGDGFFTVNFLAMVVFFTVVYYNAPQLAPWQPGAMVLALLLAYPVRRALQAAIFRHALPGRALAIWGLLGLSVVTCGLFFLLF